MAIKRHWEPFFADKALNAVTRQDIRDFSLQLHEKGLAPKTINNLLTYGETALKWAAGEGLIASDPTAGLMRFQGGETKRDVLSEIEIEKLFAVAWRDKRAYAASFLSCTTGMRSGEVRALRKNDIGEAVLDISHSFSDIDGLKSPKNGEARRASVLPRSL